MYTHTKLIRYGAFNTWDATKILALMLMVIDHIGYFFYPDIDLLRALGRGAAPLFLFLAGFAPISKIKADLLFCAFLMWVVNIMAGGGVVPLGILASIVIARAVLMLIESGKLTLQRPLEWLVVMVLLSPTMLLFQYGTLGVLFALCGYLQRNHHAYAKNIRLWFFVVTFGVYALLKQVSVAFGMFDSLVMATTLICVAWLCWHIKIRPIALPTPIRWSEAWLRLASRYTLWIYVIHFGALQLLTGKYLQL